MNIKCGDNRIGITILVVHIYFEGLTHTHTHVYTHTHTHDWVIYINFSPLEAIFNKINSFLLTLQS